MHIRSVSTRRPAAALIALFAALALTAGACSSSDDETSKSSDEKETTTSTSATSSGSGVASGILDRATEGAGLDAGGFDEDVAECVGQSVIDAVGESDAEAMVDGDPATYSPDEIDAMVTAFNECVPGDVMAPGMVSSFYEGMGATEPTGSEMTDCVAEAIDGRTGDLVGEGIAVEATDEFPELTLQVMDECMPQEDLTALLIDAFTSSGLTSAQATCVADALEGQISVTELARAGMNEGSPELESKVQAAAVGCQ